MNPTGWPDTVEVDRVVPPSGNMTVGLQQFWLGTARAGQQVRFWVDTATVHLSTGGWRIKTVPSGCPRSTWPGCAAPEPSPQVRRPQDHFGSMPVMMLAVQLWVLSAPASRAGGAAGFVPG